MMFETSLPKTSSIADVQNTSQFVAFSIAENRYAIPIEQIQQIVILKQVTPIPQVAEWVEGVSNMRGSIIPIINLRKLFGLEPNSADNERQTIVVSVADRTMGCVVDMVSQVIRVRDEEIRPAPESVTTDGADYVSGFITMDDGLTIVLDIEVLLKPDKLDGAAETLSQVQHP